jgi:hypothetical protein
VILAQFDASWHRLLSDSNVALANPCTFGAGKFFRWVRNLSVGGREETGACGSRYHDTPT